MTKIKFSSFKADYHTHRASDGTESVYFAWPDNVDADEVLQQYAVDYDHNNSDEPVVVAIYLLDDNSVEFVGKIV